LGWTPAFAGETNLRPRPFSSFRRKPESSGIEEEFDVYTITALLVDIAYFGFHPCRLGRAVGVKVAFTSLFDQPEKSGFLSTPLIIFGN